MEVDMNVILLGVIIISLISWLWLFPKTMECQNRINEVIEQCNTKLSETKLTFSPDILEGTPNKTFLLPFNQVN